MLVSEAKVAAARTQFGPRHKRPGEAAYAAWNGSRSWGANDLSKDRAQI